MSAPSRRPAWSAGGLATTAAIAILGALGVGGVALAGFVVQGFALFDAVRLAEVLGWTIFLSVCGTIGSAPLGLGVAVWARWMAPRALRPSARWLISLVADVPAVAWATGLLLLPFPDPGGPWMRACVGLALIASPAIARRALDALSLVPGEELVTAVSLGASRGEAVARVGLPRAASGLAQAVILGVGRSASETVLLLLVLDPLGVLTLGQAVVLAQVAPDRVDPATGAVATGVLLVVGLMFHGMALVGRRR